MFPAARLLRAILLPTVFHFTLCGAAFGSLFSVDQWSMDASFLANSNGSAVFFETVANPFVDSGEVTDRQSRSSTAFQFSWTDNYGDFLIDGSQRAVGQNPPPYPGASGFETCASEGGIYFTAYADLLFTLDAAYSYRFAGPAVLAELNFGLADDGPPKLSYINEAREADSYTFSPPSGTLSIQDQVLLPGGRTYRLSYQQFLRAQGLTGATADGSGYIHFTLSEIPEPAAFFPLALAALALRRRR